MTQHYRIIDCETTGLHKAKACEVAWVAIDENFNILEEQVHRVNPEMPIEEGASAIHGIYNDDVANCPTIDKIMKGFPEKLCFIGHNVRYDQGVLGSVISWNSELCTLALARRWIKDSPNHKLVTLKHHLKLSEQVSHSALGDCHTSLEVLKHVAALAGRNLVQLIELESKPKMLNTIPFGRHKGKLFSDIPKPYRTWLLAQEDLHKDIRYTLERLKIV
jgi:exodeoxyribonuclease X